MSEEKQYCHIQGEKGLLCGTTGGDLVYFGFDSDEIKAQQKRGAKKCGACGLPRCQECIRTWTYMQARQRATTPS